MLYAFSSAGNLGFSNPIVLCSLLISLIIIGIFVKRQITISNPLLNLKIFNNKIFCFSTITSMIIMLSMVGPALLIRLSMVLCLCLLGSFTINMGLDR